MTLSGVLLAGGESRRMGQDKATLVFRGKPLWRRQMETLRKVGPAEIFVSARRDPDWRPDDVLFVPDHRPWCGPLGGLLSTLERMNTTHLLALAIDVPFMTEAFLNSMITRLTAGCGVVPRTGERFEPVAAIFPRETHAELAEALRNKNFALQRIARRLIDRKLLTEFDVSDTDRALFQNLNDPSDFEI